MARDFHIQIRVPDWGRRGWTLAAVFALLVGGAAAYANVMWTPFQQGEKLTSAKMNANFKSLADAIDAINGQMAPGTKLPHLILNQGNVDLGLYMGFAYAYCNQNATSLPLVFSQTMKAPFLVGNCVIASVFFTGANCTGTPWQPDPPLVMGNGMINGPMGTIFQRSGPGQMLNYSSRYTNGQCSAGNGQGVGYPYTDTKLPNINFGNGDYTILMM